MTYEFTVGISIKDFQRILSWGNNKNIKFDNEDRKLATKLELILEDMIEEERIVSEDEKENE